MLDFFRAAGRLKTLRRQGWVDRGIPDPESVADHSYRNALMALVMGARAGLNTARIVKLMLVHDLPEAVVGDPTPYAPMLAAGASLEEVLPRWRELLSAVDASAARRDKQHAEAVALDQIVAGLPAEIAAELRDLWTDYAERRSPEAAFAAQVDKLEAVLQALEHQEAGFDSDLESFLTSARETVDHPVLVELLGELEAASRAQH